MFLIILLMISGASGTGNDTWDIRTSELLDNKILGGEQAVEGEFPWAVSLRVVKKNSKAPDGHYCGGSVVTTQMVVTACHCAAIFVDRTREVMMISVLDKIILAGTLKSDPNSEGAQVRRMKSMIIHPLCTKDPILGRGWIYDFAFAQPDKPFYYNKVLKPLKLYTPATEHEAHRYYNELVSKKVMCHASGFGYTKVDENGRYKDLSPELKGIGLNIIATKNCRRLLCHFNEAYCNISLYERGNICAASPTGGDVCKGDSGSALVCDGQAIGLTSWGPRCGEQKEVVPSMYAMVDRAEDFFRMSKLNINGNRRRQELPRTAESGGTQKLICFSLLFITCFHFE